MTAEKHREILVVDDDPGARSALSDLLEDEGYSVRTAANGREALELLRDSPTPCLILLDLVMPVMDGWEFRARQKEETRLARIPVVLVTAVDPQRAPIDPVAVLPKPIDVESLFRVLRTHC